MALRTSGPISIRDILQEMGRSPNANSNLNELATAWYQKTNLAIFNKTQHSLSDWYGKEWNEPIDIPDPILTINPTLYDGGNSAKLISIQVTSNISWDVRIVGGPPVNISVSSGTGNQEVIVDLDNNFTSEFRAGTIDFIGRGISKTFNWSQSGPFFEDGGGGGPFGGGPGGSGGGGGFEEDNPTDGNGDLGFQ